MTNQDTSLTRRQSASLDQPEEAQLVTMTPPVDVYENQDEILVIADFPGVPKDSVSIRLDRNELFIEGTRAATESFPAVALSRAFRVPSSVDADGVSAELSAGVLRVHLAKSEAAKPKRIEVRSG